jgi:hypothetical protein
MLASFDLAFVHIRKAAFIFKGIAPGHVKNIPKLLPVAYLSP